MYNCILFPMSADGLFKRALLFSAGMGSLCVLFCFNYTLYVTCTFFIQLCCHFRFATRAVFIFRFIY